MNTSFRRQQAMLTIPKICSAMRFTSIPGNAIQTTRFHIRSGLQYGLESPIAMLFPLTARVTRQRLVPMPFDMGLAMAERELSDDRFLPVICQDDLQNLHWSALQLRLYRVDTHRLASSQIDPTPIAGMILKRLNAVVR